jgi:hypothetical protein
MPREPEEWTTELPLGVVALCRVELVGADEPPTYGAAWADERDYPRVRGTLQLPCWNDAISQAWWSSRTRLLGANLDSGWGQIVYDPSNRRWAAGRFHRANACIREGWAAVRDELRGHVEVVRSILEARRLRLVQRDATYERILAEDEAYLASQAGVAAPVSDATSAVGLDERFQMLEVDSAAAAESMNIVEVRNERFATLEVKES